VGYVYGPAKIYNKRKGEKKGVILSMDEYEELLQDLEDLVAIAERQGEKVVSHEELIKELKRDGCI